MYFWYILLQKVQKYRRQSAFYIFAPRCKRFFIYKLIIKSPSLFFQLIHLFMLGCRPPIGLSSYLIFSLHCFSIPPYIVAPSYLWYVFLSISLPIYLFIVLCVFLVLSILYFVQIHVWVILESNTLVLKYIYILLSFLIQKTCTPF